jgi:SAM-dependent methyltransferase
LRPGTALTSRGLNPAACTDWRSVRGISREMQIEEYQKLAEVEDRMWYFRALHGHMERALISAERARAGTGPFRILDAGCGTGGLIRRLGQRHPTWEWKAVDLEPVACGLARARTGANVEVREASVTALPFEGEAFDAVISADVIYHVEDDAAALREFSRVLRPGGSLVVNVPAYRWLWSYHDEAVHAERRYGRAELKGKLAAAGFAVGRTTYWNTLPFPLGVVRRKLLPAPRSGSDVHLFPAPLEAIFNAAMRMEAVWLARFGGLPFGSSVLAVAQKPR